MKWPASVLTVMALAGVVILTAVTSATADSGGQCSGSGATLGDYVAVGIDCSEGPTATSDADSPAADSDESAYIEYRWISACTSPNKTAGAASVLDCGAARVCPDQVERLWRLWGRLQFGGWEPLGSQCFGRPPTIDQTPTPQVTAALVLNALRRIGLPAIQAKTQPEDKTLVNFDTIFYANPQTLTRTITLLGQRVDVAARPVRYSWHHGDGTTTTTTTPGAPYPAMDIVYNYADAHTTVQTSVDVTYTARFRVAGGTWEDIADTVTIAGPASSLRISEATPLLSGQYN